MDSIIEKINQAYAKGINNPRFQEAIEEMIVSPDNDLKLKQLRMNHKKISLKERQVENEAIEDEER